MIRFLALLCTLAIGPLAWATNPIQLENAKAGTSEWRLSGDAEPGELEGYASAASVTHGQTISFYVSSAVPAYTLNIYRMGWYGGLGARKVHGPITRTGFLQTIPAPDPVTGLTECNWTDPYTIMIPADWTTGVYLVKLTIETPEREDEYIPFVVRDDLSDANHLFQLSVTTYQAYNSWGGKSLYAKYSTNSVPARKVSFNRPYAEGNGTGQFLWSWEYNMLRFLEREGYDVAYSTNVDTHRRGSLLMNHHSFLSIGHDEYWSWEMRANVEAARDAGVSLGFFSANTCYWLVRFEPSAITGAPDRTMVGYKEVAQSQDPYALDSDPSNNREITGLWRTNNTKPPEAALLGVQYIDNPVNGDITIDDTTSAPWVFANTTLQPGDKLAGLLGYEVDAMNQFTPAGTIRLGNSPYVTTDGKSSGISHMTLYTAASGATVFATGSIQWSWGLDTWHNGASRVNANAQQITRNLLQRFAGNDAPRDCQFLITPTASGVSASAGSGTITIATNSNCAWTTTSSAAWLTLTATSGTGGTVLGYSYTDNPGAPRTGTITIADKTFTLTQQGNCTHSFSPASGAVGSEGGTSTITITGTTADCPWTATTSTPWLSITGGASGVGSGTLTYVAEANTGSSRNGEIRINGVAYAVQQSSGCRYTVSPLNIALPMSGGTVDITIQADASCFWSSSSSQSWISITAGTGGNGDGTTTISVQANGTGSTRTANIAVAGQTVTITQTADSCTYTLTPDLANFGPGASSGSFTITPSGECSWTAVVESGSSWLSITGGASGTGTGTVTYSVAQNNSSVARTGRIRAGSQAFNITQSGAGYAPIMLVATANNTSSVGLSWTAVSGATGYEVQRGNSIDSFSTIALVNAPAHTDNTVVASRTYVYRIRAMSGGNQLTYSYPDIATTVAFTDPVIVPQVTPMRAAHVTELRNAVNMVRAAAGLAPFSWTDAIAPGVVIRASHIAELREALAPARAIIGLPPLTAGPGPIISASDITSLRDGVR